MAKKKRPTPKEQVKKGLSHGGQIKRVASKAGKPRPISIKVDVRF